MHHKIQSQSLHLCPRSLASTSFGSLRQALGNGVQLHGSEILPNWLPDLLKCVIKDKTPLCIYHLYTSYQRKCWPASNVDVEAHQTLPRYTCWFPSFCKSHFGPCEISIQYQSGPCQEQCQVFCVALLGPKRAACTALHSMTQTHDLDLAFIPYLFNQHSRHCVQQLIRSCLQIIAKVPLHLESWCRWHTTGAHMLFQLRTFDP